ncbi:hypothetical protein GCM10007886_33460 [Methylobacterium gregans]|jgi:hypothetical protein|uniref:Uncharacterized protein n=2 Tax=Hyphomicrobiales TaxID=356 RepID=A0AA37HQ53_9HYPH|nr:hypothetical protein NBEOAGPD_2809 [Methylobacterium gregans]GLS55162.1 hypothetical protein GCM10007886_33460 [Methylobacterium gregans]
MPTIRRPSWRPRTIHGHRLESLKTHDQTQIMCDPQFQQGNLTEQAREFLLKLSMTAWLIRSPEDKIQVATLIKIDGHNATNTRLLESIDYWPEPLALTPETRNDPKNPDGYIYHGLWHISFVDGKVRSYTNGSCDDLWIDVSHYLEKREFWRGIPSEDKEAFAAIEL